MNDTIPNLATQGVDIHAVQAELQRLEQDLVARVPEHLFVEHILPIIACEPGHSSLEPWVHLAGSTFNKIAVVGGNQEVLFTVPAMAVSPNFDQDRESRNSLYEAMEHYKLLANVQPRAAQQYLDNKLGTLLKVADRDFEALATIDNILERYGKPRRFPATFYNGLRDSGTAASTPVQLTSIPDDIGDDL